MVDFSAQGRKCSEARRPADVPQTSSAGRRTDGKLLINDDARSAAWFPFARLSASHRKNAERGPAQVRRRREPP